MFENVLVPLDGSELSEAALPAAVEVAEKFGSHLVLLRAIDSTAQRLAQTPALLDAPAAAAANVELLEEVTQAEREDATEYLQGILAGLAIKDVEALVAEGSPAEEIVRVAEEKGASLVVMSSHGRGGLGRLLHGSVADAVLKNHNLPVLLMRPKLEDKK